MMNVNMVVKVRDGHRSVIGIYTNGVKMLNRIDAESANWELTKTWDDQDNDIFYRDYHRNTTCEYGELTERMTIEVINMGVNE